MNRIYLYISVSIYLCRLLDLYLYLSCHLSVYLYIARCSFYRTYEEIKRLAPSEASLRSMDKIGYRYPRGESYYDILARLDPLVSNNVS